MADKAYMDYTLVTPTSDDTVLGEQNGLVKRFAVSDLAAGAALADAGGAGLIGFDASETYAAGTVGAKLRRTHIQPEGYGAVGDGVADDTAAVTSAIAAMAAGRTLELIGNYKITSGLLLTDLSRMAFVGKGRIFLSGAASGAFIFQMAGTCDDLLFEGFTLYGDNNAAYSQTVFGNNSGQTLSRIRYRDLNVSGINVGLSLTGNGGACTKSSVKGCVLSDIVGVASGSGYGIHMDNCTGAIVALNQIDNASRHAVYHGRGTNNKVLGNTIKNHRSAVYTGGVVSAMPIARASGILVQGNTFIDCYDGQVEITQDTSTSLNCSDITVVDNHFIGRKNSTPAIMVGEQSVPTSYRTSDVLIDDNKFSEDYASVGTTPSVLINNGVDVTVRGNKGKKTGVTGTARFIEIGNDTYIGAAADCTGSIVKDNDCTFAGATLTDARLVSIANAVATNTSSHYVGPNYGTGVSDDVVTAVSITNKALIIEDRNGMRKGVYTDGDTTPDVAGINYMEITNTGATSITNFDGGKEGQVLHLRFRDGNTTLTNNMYMAGGLSKNFGINDTCILIGRASGANWEQIGGSDN
jgi:hypothetical protein